ncbi:STAS domain-containing protein [Nocardia sp. NPDC048505]|uniref:STAS domain-containing protein n=1 Tax=Nocardia sp. NPDC048505 TaxID=3155756 RepID=UPI0033C1566F
MNQNLIVEWENQDEHGPIVTVSGEIDATTAAQLGDALDRMLRPEPDRVLVDLSEVLFMDAAGVTVLARANTLAWPHTVFAVIAYGAAARPLQLTGMASTLVIYPHRAMALACTTDALDLCDRVDRGAALGY